MTGHHYVWGEIEESSSSVGTWKTSPGSRSFQSKERNGASSAKNPWEMKDFSDSEPLSASVIGTNSSSFTPVTVRSSNDSAQFTGTVRSSNDSVQFTGTANQEAKASAASRSFQPRDRNVASSIPKSMPSEVKFLAESEPLSATPDRTSSSSWTPAAGRASQLIATVKQEAGKQGRSSSSSAAAPQGRGSNPNDSDEDMGEDEVCDEVDIALANDTTLQDELSGIIWSKGSAKHTSGRCRPCHYFHTSTGCLGGASCKFCHIPHTRVGKSRIGMSKRILCKQIADALEKKYQGDPDGYQAAIEKVSSRSPFLRKLLKQKDEPGPGPGDGGYDSDGVMPMSSRASSGPVSPGLVSSGDDRCEEDGGQPLSHSQSRSRQGRKKSIVCL